MTSIRSTVSGSVLDILVSIGDTVGADDPVILVESMKMEIPVSSEVAGIVREVRVAKGDRVREGDVVMVLD